MKFLRHLCLLASLFAAQPLWAQGVPASTDSSVINTHQAWEMVSRARDKAGQDRHHEAVADYLQALANDGRLVETVAQEIAYQKLWREDADKAIFYFQRYLARHPDDENREVRKGLAQAFSWSGRQRQAIVLYRQLVAGNGADGGARLGLGRSLLWNNELSEGWAVTRKVEGEFPADSAPGRESENFLLTVLDSYTPPLQWRNAASWDSDGLDIYRTTLDAHWQVLGNKLLQTAPGMAIYHMPDRPDIIAPRLQLGLVGTMAHNWSFHAYGWLDYFRSNDPVTTSAVGKLDWLKPGGDLWLTWLPRPRLRVDFGGSAMALETYQAFDQHLNFTQASLSADWRLGRRFTLGASGILADFSDDNSKRQGSAHLFWKREGPLKIITGPVLTYMDFTHPYPGGYWAPDWVRNGSWRVILEARTRRMVFKFDGSLGQEKELGSAALTVAGISGHWGWRLGRNSLLAAELGRSRSRFSSASGYHRTFANLKFKVMF